jgi:sugar transferase (PEP-CTERM/EpsH1 system associated)
LLYRFEFGGLQTLLVECVRRMEGSGIRHVVICLAGYDKAAAHRLGDVELISLDRPAQGAWAAHRTLFAAMRRLKPALVHTYNISTLEYAFTAALAGVPRRVHAEHGRGLNEHLGHNRKYNLLRYALSPLIDTFVMVSGDMRTWMTDTVGIPEKKVCLIQNGIDVAHFRPALRCGEGIGSHDAECATFTIGTVGRLDTIKAQADLIDAFLLLREQFGASPIRLALVIVGEGPLAQMLAAKIHDAGIGAEVSMPGARRDIADIMRTFDVFVLPSLSEALPMTLLEAMASGVPVIATSVGGVPGLLGGGLRGSLVPTQDPAALAAALARHIDMPLDAASRAGAARRYVVEHHNIATTAARYASLYGAAPSTTNAT